ncbi:MAG TPA: SPOR domain-containing protein [Bacteroidales bacterium]|nr:SPOR domain-containing protein [Bacteroidales bacterium]
MLSFFHKALIFILFFLISISGLTQHIDIHENTIIIADPKINKLAEEYPSIAGEIHPLEGYRIQIFFDSGNLSKRNASKVREEFIKLFPDVEAYITFKEPYYRVRVGDFRTSLEANGFRKKILQYYPHAFTVNDQINAPSIK